MREIRKEFKKYLILSIALFVGPAIAVAGIAKVSDTLYTLQDGDPVVLALDFSAEEIQALEDYFGHIEDVENPPETTAIEDYKWNDAYVHVSAELYGHSVAFVSLEHILHVENPKAGKPGDFWMAVVRIRSNLTNGSIESYVEAAQMFYDICSYPGMSLYVEGSNVPSRMMPMTEKWAYANLISARNFEAGLYLKNNPKEVHFVIPAGFEGQFGKEEFDYEDEMKTFQMRVNIEENLDGYPAVLTSLEPTGDNGENRWAATIYIDGWMTNGTDTDCYQASKLFDIICNMADIELTVQGSFVPSSLNPMTKEWTKILVSEDPKAEQEYYEKYDIRIQTENNNENDA